MKTLLFGGSFNPIHNGHIGLLTWVLQKKIAEEAWLLVAPQNPLKLQSDLLPEEVRLRLCKEAIKDEKAIKVSDFEFHLPRPSYTWHTLQSLQIAYPHRSFSLLIGADNWLNFEKWAFYKEILANYELYVYPREQYHIEEICLPSNVHYLTAAPIYPYSSTSIREEIRLGKDITTKVPPSILPLLEQCFGRELYNK